jgi:ribosome-interacting GTPase 1
MSGNGGFVRTPLLTLFRTAECSSWPCLMRASCPCSMEEVEQIAQQPTSIPISCTQQLNLDTLLEMLWEKMGLVRTKRSKVTPVII